MFLCRIKSCTKFKAGWCAPACGGKVVPQAPKGVPLFHRPPGRLYGFIIMAPLHFQRAPHHLPPQAAPLPPLRGPPTPACGGGQVFGKAGSQRRSGRVKKKAPLFTKGAVHLLTIYNTNLHFYLLPTAFSASSISFLICSTRASGEGNRISPLILFTHSRVKGRP